MILMRKLRKEKGITMKRLGETIGYSESAVCRWEYGNRTPRPLVLKAIADALGYDGDCTELLKVADE